MFMSIYIIYVYIAPQEPRAPMIMKEGGVTYITLNKPQNSKSGPIA